MLMMCSLKSGLESAKILMNLLSLFLNNCHHFVHIYASIYVASDFDSNSALFAQSKRRLVILKDLFQDTHWVSILYVSFCVWKFSIIAIDCNSGCVCVWCFGWVFFSTSLDRKNHFLLLLIHSCHCKLPSRTII